MLWLIREKLWGKTTQNIRHPQSSLKRNFWWLSLANETLLSICIDQASLDRRGLQGTRPLWAFPSDQTRPMWTLLRDWRKFIVSTSQRLSRGPYRTGLYQALMSRGPYKFLLALESCGPFEVKLIKRLPARWMTETIKNEINKKYILSHEYKSIVEDTAKLQKETEYKQQKMIVRKPFKNQNCSIIMKHSIMLEKILKTPGTY